MPDLQIVSWADKPFVGPQERDSQLNSTGVIVCLITLLSSPPSLLSLPFPSLPLPSSWLQFSTYLHASNNLDTQHSFLSFNPNGCRIVQNHHHMIRTQFPPPPPYVARLLLTFLHKAQEQILLQVLKILSDLEHVYYCTYNKKSYHLKWASLHFTSLHLVGLFWCPYTSLVRDNLLWFVSCPFSQLNTWIGLLCLIPHWEFVHGFVQINFAFIQCLIFQS
jgi:hypothetical protein